MANKQTAFAPVATGKTSIAGLPAGSAVVGIQSAAAGSHVILAQFDVNLNNGQPTYVIYKDFLNGIGKKFTAMPFFLRA